MIDTLRDYFTNNWVPASTSKMENYTYTGYKLTEKLDADDRVLDVGCGTNPFKGRIQYLHGIDITDIGADEVVAIEDFVTEEKYDVAFCLGSINFGDDKLIQRQIQAVVNTLKPNSEIHWRVNPGKQDHANEECKNIQFYPWTEDKMRWYANMFDYRLVEWKRDTSDHERYYAMWQRIVL